MIHDLSEGVWLVKSFQWPIPQNVAVEILSWAILDQLQLTMKKQKTEKETGVWQISSWQETLLKMVNRATMIIF